MGVSDVSVAGACGGKFGMFLEGAILKLVGSGSPSEDGFFAEHSDGAVPAVKSFYVGGV